MKKEESVIGRNLKKGAQDGDKQSNGRHALKLVYEAKKKRQLVEVAERKTARIGLTAIDKIELLDARLGDGVGAKIERARLTLKRVTALGELAENGAVEKLTKDLEVAKMESRGYRIMRQLGLAPRTIAEYEEAKYAAQYAA